MSPSIEYIITDIPHLQLRYQLNHLPIAISCGYQIFRRPYSLLGKASTESIDIYSPLPYYNELTPSHNHHINQTTPLEPTDKHKRIATNPQSRELQR